MKRRTLRRLYTLVSVIWVVSIVALVVSIICTILMVSTDDFYTIELKTVTPPFPFYLSIQPWILLGSSAVWFITSNLREVIENVYRERRGSFKREAGRTERWRFD